MVKFLKENIFSRLEMPREIISDGGSHFCNKPVAALIRKYGIIHKLSIPYHPQTNGQVELANREIKRILEKTVRSNRKDWSLRLVYALWAYRTAYKTILGTSPYRIIFGKPCHLPMEVEHKAYWVIRRINENMNEVGLNRKLQINKFEEIRNKSFENVKVSKLHMKELHDKHINRKILQIGQRVLLYDSKFHTLLGKLKSRWIGPFKICSISSHGVCEIENLESW